MEPKPLSISVQDDHVHAALSCALRLHNLTPPLIVLDPAPGNEEHADVHIAEGGGRLRLGAVLDWLMRRADDAGRSLPQAIAFEGGRLLLSNKTYARAGAEIVNLTGKECDLILALYGAPGRILTRGQLLAAVWGYVPGVETHTLETHVYRLRQKIEADPAAPKILVTDDTGYRLIVAPA